MPILIEIFILLAASVAVVRSELFTSMAHLEKALWAEKDIADELRQYVTREEERLQTIRRIADDLESHSQQALKHPENHLANPVSAFLFTKRFTLDWEREVDSLLKASNNIQDISERIDYLKQALPTFEDLNGAVSALLRLQDTYHLETGKMASGDVGGVKTSILTASDCFELGRIAYNTEDYYHTVLWMDEAMMKLTLERNETVDRSEILDYLSFSLFKQGNVRHALTLTEELLLLAPEHTRAKNNKAYYEKLLLTDKYAEGREDLGETIVRNPRTVDEYRNSHEFTTYEALCRGEDTQPVKDQHRLKCYYLTNNNPLLILQPIKVEEAHLDPWIVLFHDVMNDIEMATIKNLATPKLGRATVHNSMTGKLETATYRISKSAWLKAIEHPIIARVNNRIDAITGLELNTAEELQVANYGIGGHYEPHFDFARKEETNAFKSLGTGNRIATWLTYMTDVEAGGATVFPYLGVKLFPEKGAAAFWFNLYRNGDGIFNTRHAACPVLVGTKWVSNKWIHERGQEFRRPCSLQMDE
ncbi:hypothetical protein ScPMuIL_004865 [Solemya velum]